MCFPPVFLMPMKRSVSPGHSSFIQMIAPRLPIRADRHSSPTCAGCRNNWQRDHRAKLINRLGGLYHHLQKIPSSYGLQTSYCSRLPLVCTGRVFFIHKVHLYKPSGTERMESNHHRRESRMDSRCQRAYTVDGGLTLIILLKHIRNPVLVETAS